MRGNFKFLDCVFFATRFILEQDDSEERLSDMLYKCMYSFGSLSMYEAVQEYYHINALEHLSPEIRERRILKKTIDLLDYLKSKKYGAMVLPKLDIEQYYKINQIVKCNHLPSERIIARDIKVEGFDFEVYRLTKSVSKVSELQEIQGYSTKFILFKFYINKHINNIFECIYDTLNTIGLTESGYKRRFLRNDYSKMYLELRAICLSNEPKPKKRIAEYQDNKELFKSYCKVYPNGIEKNLKDLMNLLDELKNAMSINPYQCNKKKFAAIVYILYHSQMSIGMKRKAVATYAKFKRLMCLYYDMPENSFKENDIKDLALDLMYRYPCFNRIKFDDEL